MLFEQYNKEDHDDILVPSMAGSHLPSDNYEFDEPIGSSGYVNARLNLEEEAPIFAKKLVEYRPPAALLHLVVSNDVICMALSNNSIVRLSLLKPEDVDNIEVGTLIFNEQRSPISKKDDAIHSIFLDPTGRHLIVSMTSNDVYYLHSSSKKPKLLAKMKVIIDSVAWNSAAKNELSTREILIGTSKGLIYEAEIEPGEAGFFKDKDEKYFKPVYNIGKDVPQPVTGLRFEPFPASISDPKERKYFVIATTPMRIYQFIGIVSTAETPIFGSLFSNYEINPGFHEMPGDLGYSELHFFSKFQGLPKVFAWLTGPGIYHGQLSYGSQNAGDSIFEQTALLSYPTPSTGGFAAPLSMIMTEFHFLLLYRDRLQAVNVLSKQTVFEDSILRKFGTMKGLAIDPLKATIWAYSDSAIFEIDVRKEDRDVWKLYLDMKQFEMALQYCHGNLAHEDKVLTAQADHLFATKRYKIAATYYARTFTSFEEVTLKFLEKGERDALREYLAKKLEGLKNNDKTQSAMIFSWLVELYLSQLNYFRDEGELSKHNALQEEFRKFLAERVNVYLQSTDSKQAKDMDIKPATIYDLIASHGRMDDLLFFADLIKDYERIISYHIQREEYSKALQVLSQQKNLDLYYKFSPVLMQHAPNDTIIAWMRESKLDPRRLIPALVRYDTQQSPVEPRTVNHAIKYLEFCVRQLRNKDAAIHNYLISLYAKLTDESLLLNFLESQGPDPCFDLKYALRLCTQEKKNRACVFIYSAMGLYEEAVELALQVDIELAKENANKPENDEQLKKKLWLRIARYVVEIDNDIRRAMAFLTECELLKIEDILPFFPDFATIDDFKDAICSSLEEYNGHIEDLKKEMQDATESANFIRNDIQELRNKCVIVSGSDKCALCGYPLLVRNFYVFPCQHSFHADCLIREIVPYLNAIQRQRVNDLQNRINQERYNARIQASGDASEELTVVVPKGDRLRNELDDIVAGDCLFCGEVMIKSIDKPFITPDELDEVAQSWRI